MATYFFTIVMSKGIAIMLLLGFHNLWQHMPKIWHNFFKKYHLENNIISVESIHAPQQWETQHGVGWKELNMINKQVIHYLMVLPIKTNSNKKPKTFQLDLEFLILMHSYLWNISIYNVIIAFIYGIEVRYKVCFFFFWNSCKAHRLS